MNKLFKISCGHDEMLFRKTIDTCVHSIPIMISFRHGPDGAIPRTLLLSPCYLFLFSSLLSLSLPSFLSYFLFQSVHLLLLGYLTNLFFLVCYFKRKGMILLYCSCLSLWPVALCDKPSATIVVSICLLSSFLFLQSFCLIVFLYSHLQTS